MSRVLHRVGAGGARERAREVHKQAHRTESVRETRTAVKEAGLFWLDSALFWERRIKYESRLDEGLDQLVGAATPGRDGTSSLVSE